MPTELLTASEAARRLGIPTRPLVRLISERQIRYVMVDGIAHVPEDALDEYEAKAS
jgi:excisionase family DNA binding protein